MFKKSKEIPKTNYILFVIMILAVILVLFFITSLYRNRVNEMKEIPVIRDYLLEINPAEVDNYIIEHPSAVLYICQPSDDVCRNFEKKFKKFAESNNLYNYVTFVNLNNTDVYEFFDKFNINYVTKKEITTNYPVVVLFEDGKVKSFVQGKKDKSLTVDDVKYFLKINEVGENFE